MKELRENKTTPSLFGGYSIKDQMLKAQNEQQNNNSIEI